MPGGRPSKYTQEIADRILFSIAEGNSLVRTLAEDDELPHYSTVTRWLRENEQFRANYVKAREDQADHDADKIGDIAEQVIKGKIDPAAARVAVDAYKWAAGKRKPKAYGDKLAIGGAEDMPAIKATTQLDVSNLSLEELDVLAAALAKAVNGQG